MDVFNQMLTSSDIELNDAEPSVNTQAPGGLPSHERLSRRQSLSNVSVLSLFPVTVLYFPLKTNLSRNTSLLIAFHTTT